MQTKTTMRHGTGAKIVVRQSVPGMITRVKGGAIRISVGVSPIVSTPASEGAALLKSA